MGFIPRAGVGRGRPRGARDANMLPSHVDPIEVKELGLRV